MRYQIKRECWNDKTYNGYIDKPYWRIDMNGNSYGLDDNGRIWSIGNNSPINLHVKFEIQVIINECKLNIELK